MINFRLMMNRRNGPAAAQRFAERRQREQDAPRLCEQVPNLLSLQLEIEERSGDAGIKHLRRVVVDHAPALFLVPCGDSKCVAGGHDLTPAVMQALRARETSFHGTDECKGTPGVGPCSREVRFDAVAEYRP
jgi:hypothetical protein